MSPASQMTRRLLGDGTVALGTVELDESGNIVEKVPVLQQALIDNIHNPYPNRSRGFVFGKRTEVENTLVDLWEGPTDIYVWPTSPMVMAFTSTSPNDTAAGSGVQEVGLHYLDDNKDPQFAKFETNGVTPVLTSSIGIDNILRINSIHATRVGTFGATAAGDISLTNVAETITYGLIKAGGNTARQAIFTVPRSYDGYIAQWQASSGSAGSHFCQTSLNATCHQGILYPGVFLMQDEIGSENGGQPIDFKTPIRIPGSTDVKLSAISDLPSSGVFALGNIMGWFEAK